LMQTRFGVTFRTNTRHVHPQTILFASNVQHWQRFLFARRHNVK